MGRGVAVLVHGQQLLPAALAVEGAVTGQFTGAVNLAGGGVALHDGDVQRAMVHEGHVVLHIPLLHAAGGDELVEVLEAGVIARVADHGAVVGDVDVAGLVLEAAERGVLDGDRHRVHRVELDDVAVTVDLVGLPGDVEAVVEKLPLALGRPLGDAETVEGFLDALILHGGGVREVLVEVLLAGEDGAPRGDATGAVVEGAQDGHALRVRGGLDVVGAGDRADELHRGGGGDAAVERAELAPELAGVAHPGHLQHGESVVGPADPDLFLGGVVGVVARVHVRLGGVLVGAHEDHPVGVGGMLEQAGEVIVEAELLLGGYRGLVVHVEFGRALDDRVTPGDEDGLCVAGRDDDLILLVRLHHLELQARRGDVRGGSGAAGGAGGGGGGGAGATGRGAGGEGGAAADGEDSEASGAQCGAAGHHVPEVGVAGGVVALAEAGVAALVGAGDGAARGGELVAEEIQALEGHGGSRWWFRIIDVT